MANVQRGEVALTVGDRVFTLVLDFEAMVLLEDVMSTPERVVSAYEVFWQVWGRPKFPPFKHTRAALWAALQRKHPDMTVLKVADLIEELGGPSAVVETLADAFNASRPDKVDVEGRPQEARQASTGEPTTSTRAGSASRKKASGG